MTACRFVAALILAISLVRPIAAQTPAPTPRAATELGIPAPDQGRPLTAADLETWLDGLMPYSLERGGIPGGVVAVVKDGRVLLAKGYGFADLEKRVPVAADRTLFRPGSIAKLFTWTAVMQLVEQGRLDLDRDINAYLDFRIPARADGPITLRHLMTHTPGFEEAVKGLIHSDPSRIEPLGTTLKRWIPTRVYRAGTTPAYSNYGTALAGYIVERVSGVPFETYVETRIFRPAGMTRSTFRQPLPSAFAADMSKGYPTAAAGPRPFEIVSLVPAGGLSATATDMARFMLAHLHNGQMGAPRLMSDRTARNMHLWRATGIGPLNRMGLGFYESNINGRRVISHSGDTQLFHSDLHLFIDNGIGLFISLNSSGRDGAAYPLRSALLEGFADRYLPGPMPDGRVDSQTAKAHAAQMSGIYSVSRRSHSNFIAALGLLGQTTVTANADGTLTISGFDDLSGETRTWREIAPFVWRDVAGGTRVAAVVRDGRVVRFSNDELAPVMVYDRTPWHRSSAWLMPALYAALAVLILTTLAWPAGALARRRYGVRLELAPTQRRGRRLARIAALATLAALIGWAVLVSMITADLNLMGPGLDPFIIGLSAATLVAVVGGLFAAAWNARLTWRKSDRWTARLWAAALLIAFLVLTWIAVAFRLVSFSTDF